MKSVYMPSNLGGKVATSLVWPAACLSRSIAAASTGLSVVVANVSGWNEACDHDAVGKPAGVRAEAERRVHKIQDSRYEIRDTRYKIAFYI